MKIDEQVEMEAGNGGRFTIKVYDEGEIEIYTPDGSLQIFPKGDNIVRLRCVPTWSDKSAIDIAEHVIKESRGPRTAAKEIIDLLRGRENRSKPRA